MPEPIAHNETTVPAMAASLEALHGALAELWAALESDGHPLAPDWRMPFEIAVAEVGANIVEHAHAGDTRPGSMALELLAFADRVEALFTDDGQALRGELERRELPPPEALAESGYGLALAEMVLDELSYARTDDLNHWRLVKRIEAGSAAI